LPKTQRRSRVRAACPHFSSASVLASIQSFLAKLGLGHYDRAVSHVLEDAITYVWLITVGLAIGIPSMQFPFLILSFRLLGSIAQANTRITYGWLGEHVLVSPGFHRTHHALRAAGRRSSNFGTALSVWDILFSTARFGDNTVETGDAVAEPALVSGSWGAQQAAGFRR
jgi:sterol desaturase/sphingolipid hydroxylase (fatty acid hydroxylase superfamily)